jgi:hypothetical protein
MLQACLDVQRDMNKMLNDRKLMDKIHAQYLEGCRKYPFSTSTFWWEPLKQRDPDDHLGAVCE